MDNVRPIILAAGKGTRLQSSGQKVLVELLGKPMLDYVLDRCQAVTDAPPAVVVGHDADEVREAIFGRDVTVVHQEEQNGTGHAVLCALQTDDVRNSDSLLVLCGDAPAIRKETLRSLLDAHRDNDSALTLLTANVSDPHGYGRVVRDADGAVTEIVEETEADPEQKRIREINTGAMVVDTKVADRYLPELPVRKTTGEIYLTDLVGALLGAGRSVSAVPEATSSEAIGVNTLEQKARVMDVLRRQVIANLLENGVDVRSPEQTVVEPEVKIGAGTVIEPFVVIRNGVTIEENCRVGPFAHLREGVLLEEGAQIGNYVEVKNSRIGRGSKAKHLSYLGDADLGPEVNIGAGTITANYDGTKKHPTRIKTGASTGSNTVLVAPVVMNPNSRTGAGTVVLQNQDVEEGTTVVGIPARQVRKKSEE